MEQTMVDRINYMLRKKNMSLRALSLESGVPYMTLSNLMKTGGDTAKLPTLRGIARCLGITLDELIDGPIEEAQKEKAPAQIEQELTPKLKQIIGLLPYTPESIQDAILAICAQTANQSQSEQAFQRDAAMVRARKALADSAETEEEQNG